MALQHSPLHSAAAGTASSLQDSRGWQLPAAYSDTAAEYLAATTAAAVQDASYLGRLKATGADALDLLNRLSTNKVIDLQPGQGAPTILTTDRGRILDVITVLHAGDHLLLLTSPGLQEPVVQFLDKYTIMEDLTVEDVSPATTALAVWGPGSRACLERALGTDLPTLELYHSVELDWFGRSTRVAAVTLSGLPGYYVVGPAEAASQAWEQILAAGAAPMGAEAYQALRVERGLPVHGLEMGDGYNPLEAGLIGSIDFAKGCYIGQEVIARLDTYQKVQKYLVRLSFSLGASVAPGAVLQNAGKAVGKVTSIAVLPSTGETIGLGYVRAKHGIAGTRLQLESEESGWAEVVDLPQLFGPGQE